MMKMSRMFSVCAGLRTMPTTATTALATRASRAIAPSTNSRRSLPVSPDGSDGEGSGTGGSFGLFGHNTGIIAYKAGWPVLAGAPPDGNRACPSILESAVDTTGLVTDQPAHRFAAPARQTDGTAASQDQHRPRKGEALSVPRLAGSGSEGGSPRRARGRPGDWRRSSPGRSRTTQAAGSGVRSAELANRASCRRYDQ